MSGLRVNSVLGLTGDELPSNLKPVTAFAWVNFSGAGAVVIRDSYNVSSITDKGNGDYKINFSSEAKNKNYAASGLASSHTSGKVAVYPRTDSDGGRETSGFSLQTAQTGGGVSTLAAESVYVIIFGGQ